MDDPDYQYPYPCPLHPDEMVTGECQDPYAAELFDMHDAMMPNCRKCVQESCDDI